LKLILAGLILNFKTRLSYVLQSVLPAKIGELNADNPKISAIEWTELIFTYVPFTNLFNATGQPSLSLRLAMSASDLPIGLNAEELTLLPT